MSALDDAIAAIGTIESHGDPNAVNPNSHASGTYQFTKTTWEGLGYNWADRFDPAKQQVAIYDLTQQNASILDRSGIAINTASLYTAHFLGAGTAAKVLNADGSQALSTLISGAAVAQNPQIANLSVDGFKDWISKKVGSAIGGGTSGVLSAAENAVVTAGFTAIGLPFLAPVANGILGSLGLGGSSSGPSGLDAFFAWLENIFSAHTAARFAVIVLGIFLILAAIWILMDGSKVVTNVAVAGAKVAALAA